jgi:hypothetical protein
MTGTEFIFWLRGYLSHRELNGLDSNQTSLIRYNLSRVKETSKPKKYLDDAILGQEAEYENEIDLYTTYGGD